MINDQAVVINPLAIEQIKREMVLPNLLMRGQRVQEAAREQVGYGHVHAGLTDVGGRGRSGSGAEGNLTDTIVKRVADVTNPTVLVGSDSDHALFVHNGTAPHQIRPRNANALFFWGGSLGMFVMVPATPGGSYINANKILVSGKGYVNHPGTHANPFLTSNLHLAVI